MKEDHPGVETEVKSLHLNINNKMKMNFNNKIRMNIEPHIGGKTVEKCLLININSKINKESKELRLNISNNLSQEQLHLDKSLTISLELKNLMPKTERETLHLTLGMNVKNYESRSIEVVF
jgi:hypothetical protein